MKRLIRGKRTGYYWKTPGEWVPHRNGTTRFEDMMSTFYTCRDNELGNVRYVFQVKGEREHPR